VKPVLVVTNLVPPERAGAFRALHAREPLELALFGGRSHHATAGVQDPGVPHRHVAQREVHALAASGRYRAVVCGTAGRTALPAAYAGARRARVPFVLWTALWDHPRTPAFRVAGSPLLHLLYREADALAVYGSHVADFARRHGARRVAIAPQAVDGAFWSAADTGPRAQAPFTALTVGRPAPYKGLDVLTAAWAPLASEPGAVCVGGPVEPETALCLAALRTGQDPDTVEGLTAVRGPVALVDLDGDPRALADRLRGLRLFAGYAGWDARQLAGEIGRGDWIVVPALPDDVVRTSGPELWARVLRRQGVPIALLATYPSDVKLN
jgi:putative AlgH/UPF0301 family transcriptional regulator